MSRWTEVESVIADLDHGLWGMDWDKALAEAIIRDAQSIDIVRCPECKHKSICSKSVQHTTHEPTSVTIGYKSVDFCSYGERSE